MRPNVAMTHSCKVCGVTFTGRRDAQYCSAACRVYASAARKAGRAFPDFDPKKHIDPSLLKGQITLDGKVLTVTSNHEVTWPDGVDRVPAGEE